MHGIKVLAASFVVALLGLSGSLSALGDEEMDTCFSNPGFPDAVGFQHHMRIPVDGKWWYFSDPKLDLDYLQAGQPQDLPGHCWKGTPDVNGRLRYFGKHFNTGPLHVGAPARFWSSDAGDHSQLYWVDLIISEWTPEIATRRSLDGYVHYHELVLSASEEGCRHPTMVAWMKHTAVQNFTFDGGPPRFRPENGFPFRPRNVAHHVNAGGVDRSYPPVYDIPYEPEVVCVFE